MAHGACVGKNRGMSILVTWVVTTISLFVASKLIDGVTLKGGILSHFFVTAIFGILNAVLGRPLFVAIGIGTLGLGFLLAFLTRLVVNALLLKFVDALTERLKIKNFKTAFLAALVMAITASVCELVLA